MAEKLPEKADDGAVLTKISSLAKIAEILSRDFNRALAVGNREQMAAEIDGLLNQVRSAIVDLETQTKYAEALQEKPLSPQEYYLHPALLETDKELKMRFASGADISAWPYKGLLLSGSPGTGKTEYARYLAHQLQHCADVHNVNMSALRNSVMPGQALLSMYRELEKEAIAKGRYVILLFDEFESLIRTFSNEETFSSTSSESYGESGGSTRHEQKRKLSIDPKGEEIIAVFKSVLSGTGGIERVFTFCTSNQKDFNPALVRSGRLKQVSVNGFNIGNRDWNYVHLGEQLQNVLGVLEAVHFRLKGAGNPHLGKMKKELIKLKKKGDEKYAQMTQGFRPLDFKVKEKIWPVHKTILDIYLGFFGAQYTQRHVFQNGFALDAFNSSNWSDYLRDAKELGTHFPADLAKHYKTAPEDFSTEAGARKALGELVFPQLKHGDYFGEVK